jgi:hypothetical protein
MRMVITSLSSAIGITEILNVARSAPGTGGIWRLFRYEARPLAPDGGQ